MKRRDFIKNSAVLGSAMAFGGVLNLNAQQNSANLNPKFANLKISEENQGEKMQKFYIIDGSKEFWGSKGELSKLLCETAKQTLESLGKSVEIKKIDDGYDPKIECDKILESDCVIWQIPAWWMGEPWIVKKYIDEVFMEITMKTGGNDGRHRTNPTKDYGKGGKLTDKKYMFSTTWNAPLDAFADKNEFFGGVGIEAVFMHLHKTMEFVGMTGFPTFMCNDVIKNPDIGKYIGEYKSHLKKYFG